MIEKDFIIQLAVNTFNAQYNQAIEIERCDAKSIEPNERSVLGYEVFTKRLDDFVRLRLYLNFDTTNDISQFKLEVDGTEGSDVLSDEVYVAMGSVNEFYRDTWFYKFKPMGVDITLWDIFLTEDGVPFVSEDTGEYFVQETGA